MLKSQQCNIFTKLTMHRLHLWWFTVSPITMTFQVVKINYIQLVNLILLRTVCVNVPVKYTLQSKLQLNAENEPLGFGVSSKEYSSWLYVLYCGGQGRSLISRPPPLKLALQAGSWRGGFMLPLRRPLLLHAEIKTFSEHYFQILPFISNVISKTFWGRRKHLSERRELKRQETELRKQKLIKQHIVCYNITWTSYSMCSLFFIHVLFCGLIAIDKYIYRIK